MEQAEVWIGERGRDQERGGEPTDPSGERPARGEPEVDAGEHDEQNESRQSHRGLGTHRDSSLTRGGA
jgi:hypothetical protein